MSGSKVKEPTVARRSVFPVDKKLSGLTQAWATFGEAKSVLQKLEARQSNWQKSGAPSVRFVEPCDLPQEPATVDRQKGRRENEEEGSSCAEVEGRVVNKLSCTPPDQNPRHLSNLQAVFGPPVNFGVPPRAPVSMAPSKPPEEEGETEDRGRVRPKVRKTCLSSSHQESSCVPFQRLDLTEDTLAALRSKVKEQKQLLSALDARAVAQQQSSSDSLRPALSAGQAGLDHERRAGVKKRKVVSALPAQSYSGFSSISPRERPFPNPRYQSSNYHYSPSHPPSSHPPSSHPPSSHPPSHPPSSHPPSHPPSSHPPTVRGQVGKIRRVQRVGAAITPSSWKAGKRLVDRMLVWETGDSCSVSECSPEALCGVVRPEPGPVGGSGGLHITAAQVLRDLSAPPDPQPQGSESPADVTKRKAHKREKERERRLKPLHSYEPEYPAMRQRHYDPANVRSYIQAKQMERKRKSQEDKQAGQRVRQDRDNRLAELYRKQKVTLQANLLHKQRSRDAYSKALASGSVLVCDAGLESSTRHSVSPVPQGTPATAGLSPHLTPPPPPITSPFSDEASIPSASVQHSPMDHALLASPAPPMDHALLTSPAPPMDHALLVTSKHDVQGCEPSKPTREQRMASLTLSALRLKERIAMETRRLLEEEQDGADGRVRVMQRQPPTDPASLERLPGVGSVWVHAEARERRGRRELAAVKIQSCYRGFKVRQSLCWRLPSGAALGSLVGPEPAPGAEEKRGGKAPALTAATPPVTITPPPPPPQEQACPVVLAREPPRGLPWQTALEGDSFSVINIFARRQEALRQSLAQLQDQAISELRQPAQAPEQASSSLYSQTFELNSSGEERDGLDGFREDSLLSQASSLKPPLEASLDASCTSSTLTPCSEATPTKATPPTYRTEDVVAPTSCVAGEPTHPPRPPGSSGAAPGRLAPHSLELRLQSELHLLESVEDSMRQLSALDGTRAASLAQQESVVLANLLQKQTQADHLAHQSKVELEEVQLRFEQVHQEAVKASQETQRAHAEHTQQMKLLQEKMEAETRHKMAETRWSATAAAIEAANQQMAAAQSIASSAASAAAREAVLAAMKDHQQPSCKEVPEESKYQSDFEVSPPSCRERQPEPVSSGSSVHTAFSERDSADSATPTATPTATPINTTINTTSAVSKEVVSVVTEVPEEERDATEAATSPSPSPEGVDEEVSFRELLPSEGHWRQRMQKRKLSSLHSSDSESEVHWESSRPNTPLASSRDRSPSPFSGPRGDSFFQFMSRMLRQYTQEEEVRARHQQVLLQLREKALQEKTQAELDWLKLKQRQLRSKGEDDLMPPLRSREQGLIRRLEEEQAEIHRLQEAQQLACKERKMLLLQQQEIARMRHSANYYRKKVMRSSAEPVRSAPPDVNSPCPSPLPLDADLNSSAGERSPTLHTPSEDLASSSHGSLLNTAEAASQPTTLSIKPSSPESLTLGQLKKAATADAQRYLTQRERWLLRRRRAAEVALLQQQELLRKEQALDEEEEHISKLIDEAMEFFQQRHSTRERKQLPRPPAKEDARDTPTSAPQRDGSLTVTCESPIATQLSRSEVSTQPNTIPTSTALLSSAQTPYEYASDTFEPSDGEGLAAPHLPTTSTPAQKKTEELSGDEKSVTDSVKSISEVTVTSGGSALESRIKTLKEQLRQRKEEMKRLQAEQRRKKRELLHQQEAKLMRKLEAVESVIADVRLAPQGLGSCASLTSSDAPLLEGPPSTRSLSCSPVSATSCDTVEPQEASALLPLPPSSAGDDSADEKSDGQLSSPKQRVDSEGLPSIYTTSLLPTPKSSVAEELTQSQTLSPEASQDGEPRELAVEERSLTDKEEESVQEEMEEEQTSELQTQATKVEEVLVATKEHTDLSSPNGTVGFRVGQRVLVGNKMSGSVRFIGPTEFASGVWVGVELDEPKGRNNGSLNNKKYFECNKNHGIFAPPSKVSIMECKDEEVSYSADFDVPSERSVCDTTELAKPKEEGSPSTEAPGADPTLSSQVSGIVEEPPISPELAADEEESSFALSSHSNSVTPLPAPPPDFSVKKEPSSPSAPVLKSQVSASWDKLSKDLVQELCNEAFESIYHIWQGRRENRRSPASHVQEEGALPLHEATHSEMERKVEAITDELLQRLLVSEAKHMCVLRRSTSHRTPASLSEYSKKRPLPTLTIPPSSHHFLSKDLSPPPLSPPSPYRCTPQPSFPAADGSADSPAPAALAVEPAAPVLRRFSSVESLSELLHTVQLTSYQCRVPSDRPTVDTLCKTVWEGFVEQGHEALHSGALARLPLGPLAEEDYPGGVDECNCRTAYVELVQRLAVDVLATLHPRQGPRPVWAHSCAVGGRLARGPPPEGSSLELLQQQVYTLLMKGQLSLQFPSASLSQPRRPGGKDVDFVDSLLIRELKAEELLWVDYSTDELQVKMRAADAILDSLLDETVVLLTDIEQRKFRC